MEQCATVNPPIMSMALRASHAREDKFVSSIRADVEIGGLRWRFRWAKLVQPRDLGNKTQERLVTLF